MPSELRDEVNPEFLFQATHTDLLLQIATGTVDPVAAARKELANRGLGLGGEWIGFPAAEKYWAAPKAKPARVRDFKVRLVDGLGNVSFIRVRDGRVSYFSDQLIPFALSNAFRGRAAEGKFLLEAAKSHAQVVGIVRNFARGYQISAV